MWESSTTVMMYHATPRPETGSSADLVKMSAMGESAEERQVTLAHQSIAQDLPKKPPEVSSEPEDSVRPASIGPTSIGSPACEVVKSRASEAFGIPLS